MFVLQRLECSVHPLPGPALPREAYPTQNKRAQTTCPNETRSRRMAGLIPVGIPNVGTVADDAGRTLGSEEFGVDSLEYAHLERWLRSCGQVVRIDVDGTGCYGVVVDTDRDSTGPVVARVRGRARRRGTPRRVARRRQTLGRSWEPLPDHREGGALLVVASDGVSGGGEGVDVGCVCCLGIWG